VRSDVSDVERAWTQKAHPAGDHTA
jgi:hypothetical protein